MKIGERILNDPSDPNKIIHQRVFDNNPYIKQVEQMKQQGIEGMGESKLVGRIPVHLVYEWYKEAGVSPDDTEACQDILRRKLLSGEFDKLRVWEGTF